MLMNDIDFETFYSQYTTNVLNWINAPRNDEKVKYLIQRYLVELRMACPNKFEYVDNWIHVDFFDNYSEMTTFISHSKTVDYEKINMSLFGQNPIEIGDCHLKWKQQISNNLFDEFRRSLERNHLKKTGIDEYLRLLTLYSNLMQTINEINTTHSEVFEAPGWNWANKIREHDIKKSFYNHTMMHFFCQVDYLNLVESDFKELLSERMNLIKLGLEIQNEVYSLLYTRTGVFVIRKPVTCKVAPDGKLHSDKGFALEIAAGNRHLYRQMRGTARCRRFW